MEVEEYFLTSDTDIAERACIEGAKALKDRPAISPFFVLGPNTGDKPFKVKVGQCRHSYLQRAIQEERRYLECTSSLKLFFSWAARANPRTSAHF